MVFDAGAITRLIIALLAIANQILISKGYEIIDVGNEDIEMLVSSIFTIIATLVAWYYNNPTSKPNKRLTGDMRELKKEIKEFKRG